MAVVSVTEKSVDSPGTMKRDGKNSYTRVFTVTTNSKTDGPITVALSAGPALNSFYVNSDGTEFDLNVRLVTKTPSRKGDTTWELTCAYEYVDPEEQELNPLKRPVKWSMSAAAFTRVAEKDIEGELVQNSATMKYNPPVEIEDDRPIVRAVRNEADFYIDIARKFKNAINSTTWKNLPPRTAKSKVPISGEIQRENDISFYSVTYEFELSEEGEEWTYDIRDAGFYEYDKPVMGEEGNLGSKGGWVTLLDENGTPYQEPVDLDGNGKRLQPGKDPVYKTWRLLREVDFNELGL